MSRGLLWAALGYGVLGAVLFVLAALMTGERMFFRYGSALVLLAGVAGFGLRTTDTRR